MDLDEALRGVANGNTAALKIVYEELRYMVYSLALSIVRSAPAAEDVLQETFLRVYEKAGTYQSGTHPKAWVLSIARNLSYDALRREKTLVSEEEWQECGATTESAILQRMELTEALWRLDETERQIVVMHLVGGLKHREISEMMGIPAGTVRWKYRQSLSRLSEWVEGDRHEAGTSSIRSKR